jgi:hypothetical protein
MATQTGSALWLALEGGCHRVTAVISPAHKRAEERAPVWGFEFTSKTAAPQEDSAEIASTLNVKLWIFFA